MGSLMIEWRKKREKIAEWLISVFFGVSMKNIATIIYLLIAKKNFADQWKKWCDVTIIQWCYDIHDILDYYIINEWNQKERRENTWKEKRKLLNRSQ